MKDLLEKIEDLLEEYKDNKIGGIDIDSDTDFEIHNSVKFTLGCIKDELDQLDDEIDQHIECMNDPSDYEVYCAEDDRRIYENIGG